MASAAEIAAMRRAVRLSADVRGTTNPNPAVGAVVLDAAGRVVSEGATQPAGGDHAEVVALAAAGERAAGATLVVTLEPCAHHGRTGPCAEAVVAAGIARVVFAVADPHPAARGGGEHLEAHGVRVEAGVEAAAAQEVLGPWVTAAGRGRPYMTWKYAATLDGRTAAADGTSRWITGEEARRDVHQERSRADAIVVGIGTVLADDPQLTVRGLTRGRAPLRVVVDSDARTPTRARVLDPGAPTLVATAVDADPDRVGALRAAGADVVGLPRSDGGVDLTALLGCLSERAVYVALLEGGATLAAAFLRADLVDRVLGYYAPMVLGAGVPVLADLAVPTLEAAPRFTLEDVARVGSDVRVAARVLPVGA